MTTKEELKKRAKDYAVLVIEECKKHIHSVGEERKMDEKELNLMATITAKAIVLISEIEQED